MSKKSLNLAGGRKLYESVVTSAENFPVSFSYDGRFYKGLGGLKCLYRQETADTLEAAWEVDETLQVRVKAKYCAEYGQSEYTAYFENKGEKPSKVLTKVSSLDHVFEGENSVAKGIYGDIRNDYRPYEIDLQKQAARFESPSGRATHDCFPYFNLLHGDGGTLMAMGWAGVWDALMTRTGKGTQVRLRSNMTLNTVVLPGESLRTALIVLIPYSGRSYTDSMNLWREWFLNCNMPRADVSGAQIQPFSTSCYSGDTGLPNSDGSISERYFTWKPSLDKVLAEGVAPDFRWVDAGWYFDPAGNTVPEDWWGTIGSWEMDSEKWPGDSFAESVDEFHRHGIKTLVWFEPERVTHVDDLVKNYGYKAEWGIAAGNSITNNIGDEECLEWTTDRIIKMMKKNQVDLYREDNNASHNHTWRKLDTDETGRLGLPRYGVAENKSIDGHYKLWDNILAYCAENGKCTYVDSCAGGGGRNDLESMRRGIPFMRSDADRTTTALRLSMTSSFCQWIPFHGAATKETQGQLDVSSGAGSDQYIYRASYLPVFNFSEAFVHNPELDFETLRTYLGEWRSINHMLTKDMYVLTPWRAKDDRYGWTALAYDDADKGESLLLAFRMEDCAEDTCRVRLEFAREDAEYILDNADSGEKWTVSGKQLQEGIELKLDAPRSSLLYRIARK